jgi:hypothetical protein
MRDFHFVVLFLESPPSEDPFDLRRFFLLQSDELHLLELCRGSIEFHCCCSAMLAAGDAREYPTGSDNNGGLALYGIHHTASLRGTVLYLDCSDQTADSDAIPLQASSIFSV